MIRQRSETKKAEAEIRNGMEHSHRRIAQTAADTRGFATSFLTGLDAEKQDIKSPYARNIADPLQFDVRINQLEMSGGGGEKVHANQ